MNATTNLKMHKTYSSIRSAQSNPAFSPTLKSTAADRRTTNADGGRVTASKGVLAASPTGQDCCDTSGRCTFTGIWDGLYRRKSGQRKLIQERTLFGRNFNFGFFFSRYEIEILHRENINYDQGRCHQCKQIRMQIRQQFLHRPAHPAFSTHHT